MAFPAILAIGVMAMAVRITFVFAALTGAGLVFVSAVLVGIIGAVHELGHIFAGSRLVGITYPKALVFPTFGYPFVRFDSRSDSVPFPHVALILLVGPLSGLAVLALVLIAIPIVPDPWGIRWMWWAYWSVLMFSQVASLIPFGETDGQKVMQLMHEKSVTWSGVGKAIRQLFREAS